MDFFRRKHFLTELFKLDIHHMQMQESSTFFSRNQAPTSNNPLSIHGRFNRSSYIAWFGLLHILVSVAVIAISVFFGILNLNTLHLSQRAMTSISGFGEVAYLILSCFYLYGIAVIIIRRFHDRNKTGWFILLCFIPVIQFFTMIYLLLARGDQQANRFGYPRSSTFIEKIVCWIMIIFFILGLFASTSLVSFMMGSGQIEQPSEIIQKGTQYF